MESTLDILNDNHYIDRKKEPPKNFIHWLLTLRTTSE